jgi:hypothetical protein
MRKPLVPAIFTVALSGRRGALVATQWKLRSLGPRTADVAPRRIPTPPPLCLEATLETTKAVATSIRAPPR